MEFAKLFLEYLKVLIWPLILALALSLYGQQIFEILQTRDVDAFGVKVSGSLDDLAQNYEQEIRDLKQKIADMEGGSDTNKQELITRLDSISGNVRQELSSLRVQIQNPPDTLTVNKQLMAAQAERRGFEAIVNGDAKTAIAEFTKAKELAPTYHNVAEIYTLLESRGRTLNNPTDWARFCKLILDKYSWGIPSDLRAEMEAKANLTLRTG